MRNVLVMSPVLLTFGWSGHAAQVPDGCYVQSELSVSELSVIDSQTSTATLEAQGELTCFSENQEQAYVAEAPVKLTLNGVNKHAAWALSGQKVFVNGPASEIFGDHFLTWDSLSWVAGDLQVNFERPIENSDLVLSIQPDDENPKLVFAAHTNVIARGQPRRHPPRRYPQRSYNQPRRGSCVPMVYCGGRGYPPGGVIFMPSGVHRGRIIWKPTDATLFRRGTPGRVRR